MIKGRTSRFCETLLCSKVFATLLCSKVPLSANWITSPPNASTLPSVHKVSCGGRSSALFRGCGCAFGVCSSGWGIVCRRFCCCRICTCRAFCGRMLQVRCRLGTACSCLACHSYSFLCVCPDSIFLSSGSLCVFRALFC